MFFCCDFSFDETTMDSCSTLLQQEEHRVISDSCESCESRESSSREARVAKPGVVTSTTQEVTNLEEAKSVIAALRARQRAQAHQMLAWRRTLKLQVGIYFYFENNQIQPFEFWAEGDKFINKLKK